MTVSLISIVCMGVEFAIIAALFIASMIIAKKKLATGLKPFALGCATFFVFVIILEGIVNSTISSSAIGDVLLGNNWLLALWGGLAAGLFEETGRFVTMKLFMKNSSDKKDSLSFGLGHGGFEALFIIGATAISNIAMAIMLNSGNTDMLYSTLTDPAMVEAMDAQLNTLATTPAWMYIVGILERIIAIVAHTSLSVLVYKAVCHKKTILYPVAILLHALMDSFMMVLVYAGLNTLFVEAFNAVFACVLALVAAKVYRNMNNNNAPVNAEAE